MTYIRIIPNKSCDKNDLQHNKTIDISITKIDFPSASQCHVDSDTRRVVLHLLREKSKKHKKLLSVFMSVGKRIDHCISAVALKSRGGINVVLQYLGKLGQKLCYRLHRKHTNKVGVEYRGQPFVKTNEPADRTKQLASTSLHECAQRPSLKTVEQPYIKVLSTQNGFPYFPPQTVVTYSFSSLWLCRALEYLSDIMIREKKEAMLYATGVRDKQNNAYCVTDMFNVKMAQQSIIHGKEDISSICEILDKLAKHRLPLLTLCHSHPGAGPPSPSGVDLSTVRDITEKQGVRDLIGLIFTTDGYVRFFVSPERKFCVKVVGEGVVCYGSDLLRINLNHIRMQAKADALPSISPSEARFFTIPNGKFTGEIKIHDKYFKMTLSQSKKKIFCLPVRRARVEKTLKDGGDK